MYALQDISQTTGLLIIMFVPPEEARDSGPNCWKLHYFIQLVFYLTCQLAYNTLDGTLRECACTLWNVLVLKVNLVLDTVNNPIAGFYDTGEEELPDYQPDFKKLRQDHLDGKMRDDLEQVIAVNSIHVYIYYMYIVFLKIA